MRGCLSCRNDRKGRCLPLPDSCGAEHEKHLSISVKQEESRSINECVTATHDCHVFERAADRENNSFPLLLQSERSKQLFHTNSLLSVDDQNLSEVFLSGDRHNSSL